VLSRAAPQISIFSVGFPMTILAGMFLLGLSLPYIVSALERVLMQAIGTLSG